MKKLIINAFGIGCVFTLIAMVVMAVCFADNDNRRIKDSISGNESASLRNRIDRLSDNVKSQNVVARSDGTYSSRNLGYVYESSSSDYSENYDPTDYPGGDSFGLGNASGRFESYNEVKAVDNIE